MRVQQSPDFSSAHHPTAANSRIYWRSGRTPGPIWSKDFLSLNYIYLSRLPVEAESPYLPLSRIGEIQGLPLRFGAVRRRQRRVGWWWRERWLRHSRIDIAVALIIHVPKLQSGLESLRWRWCRRRRVTRYHRIIRNCAPVSQYP